MSDTSRSPIVVGVNGRWGSDDAVCWAAREAAAAGRAIRLVAAIWVPTDGETRLLADSHAIAERAVRAAARLVAGQAPATPVAAEFRIGTAVEVLLEQSRDAWMTVIGRENGWTADHLLAYAAAAGFIGAPGSPTVVVNPGGTPPPPGSPVVVGIDGSPASYAAAEFAADLAMVHAAPIELLCGSASLEGPQDAHSKRAAAELLLAEVATKLQKTRPLPPIQTMIRPATAAAALIERSRRARLLALGSRGNSTAGGSVVGASCETVAELAHCPVITVNPRSGANGTDRTCREAVLEADSTR